MNIFPIYNIGFTQKAHNNNVTGVSFGHFFSPVLKADIFQFSKKPKTGKGADKKSEMAQKTEYERDLAVEKLLKPDEDGNLCLHTTNARGVKYYATGVFKNHRKELTKMFLTKNNEGKLPAHMADGAKIGAINDVFSSEPHLLAKMYLTPDNKGNLPIHYVKSYGAFLIGEALQSQPDVLAAMFLARNNEGKLPIDSDELDFREKAAFADVIKDFAVTAPIELETTIELLEAYADFQPGLQIIADTFKGM